MPRNETNPAHELRPGFHAYLDSAMSHAHYDLIDGAEAVHAEISGRSGVYATRPTVEACRAELREVLEEWVLLGLTMGHAIPPVHPRPEPTPDDAMPDS